MESLEALLGIGLMAFFAVFFVIMVLLYVYISFAFMAIGRKANDSMPGLAWIPYVGPYIIAFRASGMHWWPWLLLIGLFIPFVNILASLAFMVFSIIWTWKLFEAINKPGWWAVAPVVPVIGQIAYLIFVGMAAWGKD